MKTTTISLTGSGAGVTNTDPVRVNWRADLTALQIDTDGSTTGFTAQYTLTPPDGYASAAAWAAAAVWSEGIASTTADAVGTVAGPIHGVRLQADANGTDTGALTVIQSSV